MSIPKWRKVEYSDDGCSIYECLSCYKKWEARTDPEHAEWKLCPYCGTKWVGHIDSDDKKYERKNKRYISQPRYDVLLQLRFSVSDGGWTAWDNYTPNFTLLDSHFESHPEIQSMLKHGREHPSLLGKDQTHQYKIQHFNTVAYYCKLGRKIIEGANNWGDSDFYWLADGIEGKVVVIKTWCGKDDKKTSEIYLGKSEKQTLKKSCS